MFIEINVKSYHNFRILEDVFLAQVNCMNGSDFLHLVLLQEEHRCPQTGKVVFMLHENKEHDEWYNYCKIYKSFSNSFWSMTSVLHFRVQCTWTSSPTIQTLLVKNCWWSIASTKVIKWFNYQSNISSQIMLEVIFTHSIQLIFLPHQDKPSRSSASTCYSN